MNPFIALFIVGLNSGFGPCIMYCAPVVYPYIISTRQKWLDGIRSILIFSIIRLISHIAICAIAIIFGQMVLVNLGYLKKYLYIIIGIVICFLGLMTLWSKKYSFWKLYAHPTDLISLGILMALFPCLPRLAVIGYITMEARNIFEGLYYSLGFGLGEFVSPIVLLGLLGTFIPKYLNTRLYHLLAKVTGLLLIFLGIKIILPQLNLIK